MSDVLPLDIPVSPTPPDRDREREPERRHGVRAVQAVLPSFALAVALGVGALWGWMATQGPPGGYPPPPGYGNPPHGQQPANPFAGGPPANPFAGGPPAPPPHYQQPQQPYPPPQQPPPRVVRSGGGGGSSMCGTFCAACAGEACGEAICCGCDSAVSTCMSTSPMTLAMTPKLFSLALRSALRPEAIGAVGALLFPMLLLGLWRRREAALEG